MITFGNACRASNLINITIEDFENDKKDNTYDAWSISSTNFKTSLLYGEKKILLGDDLYTHAGNFKKFLRHKITTDNKKQK